MRKPRPLDAVSVVFAGFIFLVLLSQLSAHVLGQAVLSYHPGGSPALAQVQNLSEILAVSAAVLGLAFGGAVLMMTRKSLGIEIEVYRANGLRVGSAARLMLYYHPIRPLAWLLSATTIAILGDLLFGLDARIPAYLAAGFAALLLGWVFFLVLRTFKRREFHAGRGRVG